MMNWKNICKEVFGPVLRYCPVICVLGLMKNMKNLRIVCVSVTFWTGHLSSMNC
jgi:hypothetical protein